MGAFCRKTRSCESEYFEHPAGNAAFSINIADKLVTNAHRMKRPTLVNSWECVNSPLIVATLPLISTFLSGILRQSYLLPAFFSDEALGNLDANLALGGTKYK